ncbi:Type III restriction-modification enzyme helicase subunit [Burkholderia pseudomallei]|uniref:Type III restriction-modification enzyme helicase subunit n=2 Tax=Burkholderia pseudomallei TaxID=28450 RepID=Q3JN33_BURP1|nr:DEAD/DEAH box helicase family protein [Burkholderia pseudomallei]ABA50189.1 Type III restriction-modification enzyme helicase subunit [Burkholderia pseudomallei 1710b]AIS47858.1 type III restriction enzyme, res subunit [Burkholderia pseudomallei]EET09124.1 type III restriction-modification enzyme helicase subunit [Burkholderia pseudomallei 1710a]KGD20015.1 type III restriction enzyme, res subunit [Burkholderia pseudomallei]OMT70581.1 type III restriction endonuclease subunit R [Burkholderia
MNTRVLHAVTGRLSLRPPQAEALIRLTRALDAAPGLLSHERDVSAILSTLVAEFSTLEDFEREFPSLCFALATGVGKTRLMGAFIAYLHLAHGINNFFVLAPNLTIYNKLIADFTRNTPKYVFKGIAEFAQQPPLIITGDNYDQTGSAVDDQPMGFAHDVRINIFNISKINSEVRGGKEPRIKRMREVLGDSYFNHLANLPDLVLLMDESHRYRASAGVRAINELQPLFGLEVTATPFVESSRGPVPFKNVLMDYPLARALEDGFVKEPAVVTQRNFDAKAHTPEEIEKIKLEDGVRLLETTKVELLTYARENSVKPVKPFMLVIARDTTHAAQLKALIDSDAFYEGRYRGRVIQVDSSRTGAEEEEMITRLLAVESVDEPTEIVIHVNMLKEGWDVTNLYTIVPLRAANARTLIEQSIGRGLRLPYGKRTGVSAVDRLNIVAHDKFQEIIDEANRSDSPIRLKQVILDAPSADDKKISVQVESGAAARLGLTDSPVAETGATDTANRSEAAPKPIFTTEAEKRAARVVMDVIGEYEVKRDLVPTIGALLKPEVQREILAEVEERLKPLQGDLLVDADESASALNLSAVVTKTTEILVQQTIDIPRIAVVPSGEVTTGFHPFSLDVSQLNLQPGTREIVIHNLHTNEHDTLAAEIGLKEQRPEDYIVHALVDFDDIDYVTDADLLYDLAGQMVQHLRGYLSEDEVISVLDRDRRLIAREIHAQMMAHFWEAATEYEVQVSRGFTELRACTYTATAGQTAHHFRETVTEPSRIKQMLFGGFARCLYPLQKFDSDTERRFAVILERDASKWFKPAKGQFQIYYKVGIEQPEYIPDFVAETDVTIFMVETKARTDINSQEVQAKAAVAARWCKHASNHAASVGTKPWKYLLVPHDEINESRRLADFLRFEIRCN